MITIVYDHFNKFIKEHTWSIPVLVGLVLRLAEASKLGISNDEGFTMWLIRYNPIEIILRTARDVHPPLYYLFARLWASVFGNSVFSIRFLSILFSVGAIFLVYKIIELIWNKRAAYWTSMIVAFSPFMVLLGLQARMYSVVVFFATLATYNFVKYLLNSDVKYLYFFVLSMAVAMYSQYYSIFVVISLWVILAIYTPGFFSFKWKKAFKQKLGVFNRKWCLANLTLLILYLPWLQVIYSQFARVSMNYWIKPEWINARTIPDNLLRFIIDSHLNDLYNNFLIGPAIYWVISAIIIFSACLLFRFKDKRKVILSLFIYGFLPMLMVFVISKLRTPVYQDRYFSFSVIGIFSLWGCLVASISNKYFRVCLGTAIVLLLSIGIMNIQNDVGDYQMKKITDQVVSEKHPGDQIVSGSVYSFLNSSYYFGYGNIKLISKGVDGYLETSLFYDQTDQYLVNPDNLPYIGNRIWVIDKRNEDNIEETPIDKWYSARVIENGDVRATLYIK